MNLQVDVAWVAVVLLVSIRVAPLVIVAPVLGSVPAPALIRGGLVVAIAVAIVAASGVTFPSKSMNAGQLALYAASELTVGAAIAFGVATAFAAVLFGGRLLDFQFGFSLANLIDPTTRTQAPLIGTALNLMAVAAFFAANGHHLIFRALVQSLEHFPPGHALTDFNFGAVFAQFGTIFTVGVAIAAPAVFAVLLLDIAFAVVSRTMPQMNVFIVAIPFKTALGIAVLALSLPYMGTVMERDFESIARFWNALLS
jgi:flagellar biosynthetic protein FliR